MRNRAHVVWFWAALAGCGWLAVSFATGIIKIVGSLPISGLDPRYCSAAEPG